MGQGHVTCQLFDMIVWIIMQKMETGNGSPETGYCDSLGLTHSGLRSPVFGFLQTLIEQFFKQAGGLLDGILADGFFFLCHIIKNAVHALFHHIF